MVIIMLGAPGTGKGTIASILTEKLGMPQVSTGDIFRKNIKEGKKVDIVINLTTPEEEIIERIVNRRVCSNQECKTVYNVLLNPPKVDGICDKCGSELIQRKDDTPETVKARLSSYMEQTSPVVDYYEKQEKIYSALVSKSVNKLGKDVAEDVVKYIKENF